MISQFRFLTFIFAMFCAISCNEPAGKKETSEESKADSLYEKVMDGHDVGMARTPRLSQMQKRTRAILDSIAKLPAAVQEEARPYREKLDSALKQLEYAEFAMNKWMEEFKYDSAKNDIKKRIEYLNDENSKVTKVKESILNSLQFADSVVRTRF